MKAILLECDLCGGKMASTAIACPHCGNPNSAHTPTLPQPTNTAGKRTKKMTRRADRRYETTISTGKYNPDTGELIVVHVYGKTKAEFENNKAKVRDALNRGTYASDKGHTVASWAKVWYETYKPGNKNYDNIIIGNAAFCKTGIPSGAMVIMVRNSRENAKNLDSIALESSTR